MRRHLTSSCYSMKLSAIMRCMCVLSGCTYSGVFQQVQSSQKKTKEPNDGVLLRALLFGCVVSFGVCHLCLDPYRRNRKTRFDCITKVKNQNLGQVYPWHHTQWVLLIPSRCQISKISYSHVQDSQVTTLWSFLVVRKCFENLSWYFLAYEQALCLGKKISSSPLDQRPVHRLDIFLLNKKH